MSRVFCYMESIESRVGLLTDAGNADPRRVNSHIEGLSLTCNSGHESRITAIDRDFCRSYRGKRLNDFNYNYIHKFYGALVCRARPLDGHDVSELDAEGVPTAARILRILSLSIDGTVDIQRIALVIGKVEVAVAGLEILVTAPLTR